MLQRNLGNEDPFREFQTMLMSLQGAQEAPHGLLEADVRGKSGSRSAISFLCVINGYSEIRRRQFVLNDRSSLPRCPVMPSQQEPASAYQPTKGITSRLVVHVYRIPWDGRKRLLSPTFLLGRFADSA